MATLGSPGVSVTVVDESFYTPAAPGTIPFIFVATKQDKTNPSKGSAQGTTKANAGKVWLITSQRDLTDTFGTPLFYQNNGTSIHGGELNEYGLQAAYSLLGVTSRAYVARADVDLGQLQAATTVPAGDPLSGTYWVDTDASLYGVFEWDSTAKTFTNKIPKIIDADNVDTDADGSMIPKTAFGNQGDYAMVVTSDNENTLYFKKSDNTWTKVVNNFNSGKTVVIAPHTSYPDFTSTGLNAATGSVWIKTTTPGYGANWSVKLFNGSTKTWGTVSAPIYSSTRQALQKIDYTGGGKNIAAGTLFIESSYKHHPTNAEATFKIWRRAAAGATSISVTTTYKNAYGGGRFFIRETLASATDWSAPKTVQITAGANDVVGSLVPAAISSAGFTNITATWNETSKTLTISHKLGGDFELLDSSGLLGAMGFTSYDVYEKTGTVNLYVAPDGDVYNGGVVPSTAYTFLASNWRPLVYEAKASAPYTNPADGTLWYDANLGVVDIMVHDGTKWSGYRTVFPNTDSHGPIVSATAPTQQVGGHNGDYSLVDGDIWVSTADSDSYGKKIYVWDGLALEWVLQDPADQSSPTGWLFNNARWSDNGQDGPHYLTPVTDLLVSDYVDPDAPDPDLYPKGMRLWNLRRSGFTVKKYVANSIDQTALNVRYENDDMQNYAPGRWTCVTPNNEDGSGAFGRHAQRKFIVSSLKAMIDTNTSIRDTDTLVFNLIACPGYPETMANMVAFNTDIGQTAFVVGDTPFRLAPSATALSNWGNNTAKAYDNGEDGLVTADEYLGVFYPSGYTTDNNGNNIVVPPSHMMLRTIVNSDAKSYQWFAPAGLRRGGIDNATSVGYIDNEGEFKTASLYEGLRDTLHDVKINPIATLPGIGLVNYGQYTRAKVASALDRINVVRLVAFLRRQLTILSKPYLFEPNDAQTRREIKAAAESLLIELVGQRALYDFIVVCDTTNNTPARIDKSELYMDIAIEPVKAVEFIYIPLRIKNTGEIASGK
jgi:hypothetical protein